MKHLGDITKINGADAPIVDIITGGSPCQDLSVAGKRAGLAGERSGLFMEQIRIIKEMREADRKNGRANEFIRPRYMVWENVPGALSSNGGEDFRAVLEETAKVADETAAIPRPSQKWGGAGAIVGYGWSIAWRVHDAQFWGVPQRRKRIALVADFGGHTAPEILFERKSVFGYFEPCGEAGQETAGAVGGGVEGEDVTGALRAEEHGHQPIVYENHSQDSRFRPLGDICQTVSSTFGMGGNNQPLVVEPLPFKEGTTSLRAQGGDNGGGSENIAVQNAIVRRLTPLECERLQEYPDGWTDIGEWVDSKGKKHKDADSPRYKALGNSIALPFWQWMARRICAQYERTVTMASLFDGIGGFPLVFQRCGSVPVWASEIEEFPIAVTKYHFGEEQ